VLGSILIHSVGNVMAEIITHLTTGAPAAVCLRLFRFSKGAVGKSVILEYLPPSLMIFLLPLETAR
jgi:hypothetical protein